MRLVHYLTAQSPTQKTNTTCKKIKQNITKQLQLQHWHVTPVYSPQCWPPLRKPQAATTNVPGNGTRCTAEISNMAGVYAGVGRSNKFLGGSPRAQNPFSESHVIAPPSPLTTLRSRRGKEGEEGGRLSRTHASTANVTPTLSLFFCLSSLQYSFATTRYKGSNESKVCHTHSSSWTSPRNRAAAYFQEKERASDQQPLRFARRKTTPK